MKKNNKYLKVIILCLLVTTFISASNANTNFEKNEDDNHKPNEYFPFLEDSDQFSIQSTELDEIKKEAEKILKENERNVIVEEDIQNLSHEELAELNLLPLEDISKSDFQIQSEVRFLVPSYLRRQINTYYCGPAATLQAITTAGNASSIPGTTTTAKQQTLGSNGYLYTDRDNGTWIEYIPAVMNEFVPRARSWTTRTFDTSSSSKSSMQYMVRSNHSFGDAVIYLVKPGPLSYYSGNPGGHYISGSGIYYRSGSYNDYANIDLRLNDPHYSNNYYGVHIEPFNNVVDAMHKYSTERGPANIVY
ncbi:peptidase C39-like protein [Natranaerovirga hydrolytica]|uniref:Peptidase C39-like protein n=1 Tax=Natranaerovirga hydrolytica TaxID=680378 RepID=A0A4R1MNJ4_9FIRM|nr:C39 family peptidase [Natranaerovirga hydrolytica]TCK92874.1 peptidase C39-like protein [Natranaerovirga hydrolytica]